MQNTAEFEHSIFHCCFENNENRQPRYHHHHTQQEEDMEVPTTFTWTHGGNSVFLVGSFTKWLENKIPLSKDTGSESWSTTVKLPVGIHSYKFFVDGQWRYADEQNKITDENGNINNCLSVTFPKRAGQSIPKTWSPSTIRRRQKPESEILHNQLLLNGVQEIPRKNYRRQTSENFSPNSSDEEEEQDGETERGLVRSPSTEFGPISNNDYHTSYSTSQHRLMIVMVGLPARGKSCIAHKLDRYLNWMGYNTKVFNLGNYRRSLFGRFQSHDFFRQDNPEGIKQRERSAQVALQDAIKWYCEENGTIAIYDGTNCTRDRRQKLLQSVEEQELKRNLVIKVIFVEVICTDPLLIEENIRSTKVRSPEYVGVPADDVVKDFVQRIRHYKDAYDSITNEDDFRYIKIFDEGRQMVTNRITGFLPSRVMFFLTNMQTTNRPIYLVRHGQSTYNLKHLLGGDSELTPLGKQFADILKEFILSEIPDAEKDLCLWSSTMIRTIQTAENIPCAQYSQWKFLEEIQVGVCDGMTYGQIKEKMPDEYHARAKDKLRYRYPRGESYEDLIRRVETPIIELERQRKPILIIAHRAVLRCLYAYFMNLDREKVPHVNVPLHCVIKLTPHAYGVTETRFQLMDPIEEE